MEHPYMNYNFKLWVENQYDIPCKGVRAMNIEMEYDYIQEGGLNDYVHIVKKPTAKIPTLEIERYRIPGEEDVLLVGTILTKPIYLYISNMVGNFEEGKSFRCAYSFDGCQVMKKSYGDLNAEQGGFWVETVSIGYQTMKAEG